MEIVELFPGCLVPYDLYCRARAWLVVLCACLAYLAADRALGLRFADPCPPLPPELVRFRPLIPPAGTPDARVQLAYLDRFFRARTEAPDLARYVAGVAPPEVRLKRLTVIGADTIAVGARSTPTLHLEGRAPDGERLKAFVESLRTIAPTAAPERTEVASALGFGFRVATDTFARETGVSE